MPSTASDAACVGACAKPLASLCAGDGDCHSGFCRQGVCCDRSCDGPCESCNQLHAVGMCMPRPSAEAEPLCGDGALCSQYGECVLGVQSAQVWGDGNVQQLNAMAGQPGGGVIMAGYAVGQLQFERESLNEPGGFVARLDALGRPSWALALGQGIQPRAVNAADGLVLGLEFAGTVELAGVTLSSQALDSALLGLSDSGAIERLAILSGSGDERVQAIAQRPDGGWVVAGSFSGELRVDDVLQASQSQAADAFVMLLDNAGEVAWTRVFGSTGNDRAATLALAANGDIVVAGAHNGPLPVGDDVVLPHVEAEDAFVVRLSAAGEIGWARAYGGTGSDGVLALAFDAGGDIFMSGHFTKSINFGDGAMVSLGCEDVFVARLGPNAEPRWSLRYGDAAAQLGEHLSLGDGGEVVVAGQTHGTIDLGWGGIAHAGAGDVHVAAFSAAGEPLWARAFGDAERQRSAGLALHGDKLTLAGTLAGTLQVGDEALVAAGLSDAFALQFGW